MRVTTQLWVSAILRRVFSSGGYGAVVTTGAAEAGAVFVAVRTRTGCDLYAPAAQASYDEARPEQRGFTRTLHDADDATVEGRIARERRFDPDLWVVELEADDALVGDLLGTQ